MMRLRAALDARFDLALREHAEELSSLLPLAERRHFMAHDMRNQLAQGQPAAALIVRDVGGAGTEKSSNSGRRFPMALPVMIRAMSRTPR